MNVLALHALFAPFCDDLGASEFGISLGAQGRNGMIYIISEKADIRSIRIRLQQSKIHHQYAGFLVDYSLIPEDWKHNGYIGDPPNWLKGIHAVAWGKIYVVVESKISEEVEIRCLHLEPTEDGERCAMWSEPIEIRLQFDDLDSSSRLVPGQWKILTLGHYAWWKETYYQNQVHSWVQEENLRRMAEAAKHRQERASRPPPDPEEFRKFWEEEVRKQQQRGTYDPVPPQPKNSLAVYCDVLGIAPGVSYEEARGAYRKLMMKHHPDMNKNSQESLETTKKINKAWESVCYIYNWRR